MVMVYPDAPGLSKAFVMRGAGVINLKGRSSSSTPFFSFDVVRASEDFDDLRDEKLSTIIGASVEAVWLTTNEIKQRMRDYIDAHFGGSEFIGGEYGRKQHRRVAFAAVQSKMYNDQESKGQYTGLIYSKFGRGRGPASFVDYLLLHVTGGQITAANGGWLRIHDQSAPQFSQVGNYKLSGSRIFFKKSRDGAKLFLLRATGKKRTAKLELLATLMKAVTVKPDLAGIDDIAAQRPDVFIEHFDAALRRQGATA